MIHRLFAIALRYTILRYGMFCCISGAFLLCSFQQTFSQNGQPKEEKEQSPSRPAAPSPSRNIPPASDSLLSPPGRSFMPLGSMANQNSANTRTSTTATMTKSPIEALWRSAIPGWGQLYVESYWKAPIFFLGAATCVGGAILQGNRFAEVERQYAALDSLQQRAIYISYVRQREYYRDTRDAFIIAAAAVWALAAIDAFVGAHLYDFDVSDEIPDSPQKTSVHITPYLDPVQVRVGVAVRW